MIMSDNQGATYYRIEKLKLQIGSKITRSGDAPLAKNYSKVEEILLKHMPNGLIPRENCVYMRDGRDFRTMGIDSFDHGYVHVISPCGTVEARDISWIGVLQVRYPREGTDLRIIAALKSKYSNYEHMTDEEVAIAYWTGKVSDDPATEYVCREAEVISVDAGVSPVRPSSILDVLKLQS